MMFCVFNFWFMFRCSVFSVLLWLSICVSVCMIQFVWRFLCLHDGICLSVFLCLVFCFAACSV